MREFGMGGPGSEIILASSAIVYHHERAPKHDPAREKAEAPHPDPAP